jgi:hypothetical protein
MVVAIIILIFLSNKNNGFMHIATQLQHNDDSILQKYVWSSSLGWTTLPSLILTLYNLGWSCIAAAAIDRQPFVDLLEKKRVAATQSISLDYRTIAPVKNIFVALKNRHYLLGMLMFITVPMSFMAALSAHLIVLRPVMSTDSISLAPTSTFNASGITPATDLRRSLDLVVATRIYDASPPPWTDGQYAFPSISLPFPSTNSSLTASVDAKAAFLNCSRLDSTRYTAILQNTADPSISRLAIAGTDRGCEINAYIMIQAATPIYLRTFSVSGCASDVGDRRFGLVSGNYSALSPTRLKDFSIISCIPQYWTCPGKLLLSTLESKKAPVLVSFTRNTTSESQFGSANKTMGLLFESGLNLTPAIDITDQTLTTEFGRILLQIAQSRSATPLEPNLLQDIMSKVFTSAFAMLSNTELFTKLTGERRETIKVERATIEQRLFVYIPVAIAVCAMISLSVICTTAVLFYSQKHASILREEPSGLLSYADILFDSIEIVNLVGQVRAHPKYDGRIIGCAKKYFELDEVYCGTTKEKEERKITVDIAKLKELKRPPIINR